MTDQDRCYTVSVGRPDMLLCYRGSAPPTEDDRRALAEIANAVADLMADLPERCYARDRSASMLLPCLQPPDHIAAGTPHRTGTGREWPCTDEEKAAATS